MGLSVSDAIRLMLKSVASERTFNIAAKAPSAETMLAIEELESGRGRRCKSMDELYGAMNEGGPKSLGA
jgi:DNA-damage-inducible protein J